MKKQSNLYEKPARIPEIRESKWEQIATEYIESVRSQKSESAKSHRFLLLLNDLFGIQPGFIDDYVSGIEKYVKVKQKDRLLKGRVAELFGNLVIEFERNLDKTKQEAEEQLKLYVACLWSQEASDKRTPYLCAASDGIKFNVYSPAMNDLTRTEIQPEDIQLLLIEHIKLDDFTAQEMYFWLDRYFLRKEILSPKTDTIIQDFGANSHAFQRTSQILLFKWKNIKAKSEFKIIYDTWEKYLRIVYGTIVAEDDLFIRHTYLATLAKLMAWIRLSESKDFVNDNQILSIFNGHFFKDNIENFLEEDFFSWLIRAEAQDVGLEVARYLLSLLKNYNLRELTEDVLKCLYQELVDPKTRHDLGEYYTPDWLSHRMIKNLLEKNPEYSLLDPSCGSGTFLYLAIREKRNHLNDSTDTLRHILDSVVGIDIHPLAVIIAKTNYVLALGDLLKKRSQKINIPVYLADTMRLPELELTPNLWMKLPSYRIILDDQPIHLPEMLLNNPSLNDEAIDSAEEFAVQHRGKKIAPNLFFNFVKMHYPSLAFDEKLTDAIFQMAEILKGLIESGTNSIWAFILKNIYKPLFLRNKFDVIVGNPPWLSYRYIEQVPYQKFVKEQITRKYQLLSGKGELITHLELGTLFLLRAAELYLKQTGTIAFVLPRSIFTADQHDALRQGIFKSVNLNFQEIWDLEDVVPLFNVPSCVLIARKEKDAKVTYPVKGMQLSGKLAQRNASLLQIEKHLSIQNLKYHLHRRGNRSYWGNEVDTLSQKASFYKKRFFQGATIVPRSFWFVDVKTTPLGINPRLPDIESSKRARNAAKNPYKDVMMSGKVESNFLYATLLSTDLLPFGHLDYRLVVLPIIPIQFRYKLITAEDARMQECLYLSNWLEKAQTEWEKRRAEKAKNIDFLNWLDYRKKLTSQNPLAKYRVLYPMSATYLCATVVEDQKIEFDVNGQTVTANGFLSDYATYYLETEVEKEAYYLTSILNAPFIDSIIKPMQTHGLWGPRHICKKVLEFPIPQFDDSNSKHLKLAESGEQCSQKVTDWIQTKSYGNIRSIGKLRAMVREMLKKELNEIDAIVQNLLNVS